MTPRRAYIALYLFLASCAGLVALIAYRLLEAATRW